MLSALTVSPSGRISVCSGSGVSSAREEPKSSDFALHFRIRLVYGDCLSQPHTFIYLFLFLTESRTRRYFCCNRVSLDVCNLQCAKGKVTRRA